MKPIIFVRVADMKYYQEMIFGDDDVQEYMFEARTEDCCLLPYPIRSSCKDWYVPQSTAKHSPFGFGRANVWYAGSKGASDEETAYVERMIQSIDNYSGDHVMERGDL